MKSRIFATTGLIALLATTPAFGVFAQGTTRGVLTTGGKMKRERHPEILKAIRELEAAARSMRAADHDFAGHRQAALDLTTKAIAELKLALRADKK